MMTHASPVALVVEDDEHIACLLQLLLERAGYAVHVQPDGAAGKRFIEQAPPVDVALLDGMMPFHDGVELVRLMRSRPGWDRVPALMLTSRSQESDIVQALNAGANDYIVKPFRPNELVARVSRFVQAAARA